MTVFGENVKLLRKINNLTQEELSKELEISRATVSAWENGKTEANFEMLEKIVDFFNISYDDLLRDRIIK